ncbi:unnamed protein product [Cyberlindnera jadinii]|uniref:Uncharacterized protein n=1 Tax=Cyberlindnera jadinii (strain ATCC 18201 / CBS 1600 / BCRC 20928 / JCM 3617 / NBRC 0987 / NRRL Y-1542) TaxID=983966 RepID=A0A0H5BZL5_CYBJN|nr:unnamed protein product [Cyberlindnera jadinii]
MQNPLMGVFPTKWTQYTTPPSNGRVTESQTCSLPSTTLRPPPLPASVATTTVTTTDQSRTNNYNNANSRDKDTESTDDIAEIFLELATRKPSVVSVGDSTQRPTEHGITRETTLKELLARQIQEQKIMIEDKVRTLHQQRVMMDNNVRQIHHQMMMVDHEILMAQYHRNMLEQRLKVVSDGISVPDISTFQYQPQVQAQAQPGVQSQAQTGVQSQQTKIDALSTGSKSQRDFADGRFNGEPGGDLTSKYSNSDTDKTGDEKSVKADGYDQHLRKTRKKGSSKKATEKKIRWSAEYTTALSRSMLKYIGMHENGVVPKEIRQKIVDDLNEQFPNVNFGIITVGAELTRIIKVTKTKFLPVYQTSKCGINFAKKKLVMKSSRKLTMREYDEMLDVMSRDIAKRLKIPTPSVLNMFYDNCEIFMNVSMFLMGDMDYFIKKDK